ncbi:hypothetical protein NIIDMKKI_10730 [Mycobacterium kansasii]|uniref:N5,N10-methylenetetrahydromethanopterin reductase domain protein n=1 Tax=Mycobacterium kansasii TaxID=1768 RepID=A0A1V3XJB5_MYCKA|nr:N5,N10-methylenetetrahydromethanopterin reductase domain protein [Mycobacterium kansasii]OOK80563.1 N5,N10-methylenetetrahydromethanopterin reductase domain protein [Mycobacterium kansasii]BCI85867.1 hypothetical protein NIIDMKKI_10730 [Mycobacterium kansasii]
MVGEFVGVPAESDADADPPPDRWSSVAMLLASVIGSCSTGNATAVDSRTREVTAEAAPKLTHGSSVRI